MDEPSQGVAVDVVSIFGVLIVELVITVVDELISGPTNPDVVLISCPDVVEYKSINVVEVLVDSS